jgi:hypothetical protein
MCNNVGLAFWAHAIPKALLYREVSMFFLNRISTKPWFRIAACSLLAWSVAAPVSAQTGTHPAADQDTLQLLLKRIDQLEARVRQLEADKQQAAAPSPDPRNPGAPMANALVPKNPIADNAANGNARAAALQNAVAQTSKSNDPEQNPSDNAMMDRMDVSKTLLQIRGFGDISLHGDTKKGDTTSFSLGQLDLFVTSDVSDKFKFLSEIVFEAGPDDIYNNIHGSGNSFGVDIERYLLQYSHNDFFNVSVGRGHTAIGYYNTAYHHSSWLQTTTGRPILFDFEDHGGILPIHMVGVSVSGQVPSGPLGLHYVAEMGNGRASRKALDSEPVQNEIDDQNHKAYNLALFARPEAVRGLQAGFSYYNDLLAPQGQPKIAESILAAHAILVRPKYEWLNEAVLDRHALQGTSLVFNTPGFYSQVSKQFGSYRPYFRYQYLNVANREPVFPDVALRHGPSAGLRYDASESVALKFQYDYTFLRDQPGVNELALQLGFTF